MEQQIDASPFLCLKSTTTKNSNENDNDNENNNSNQHRLVLCALARCLPLSKSTVGILLFSIINTIIRAVISKRSDPAQDQMLPSEGAFKTLLPASPLSADVNNHRAGLAGWVWTRRMFVLFAAKGKEAL